MLQMWWLNDNLSFKCRPRYLIILLAHDPLNTVIFRWGNIFQSFWVWKINNHWFRYIKESLLRLYCIYMSLSYIYLSKFRFNFVNVKKIKITKVGCFELRWQNIWIVLSWWWQFIWWFWIMIITCDVQSNTCTKFKKFWVLKHCYRIVKFLIFKFVF